MRLLNATTATGDQVDITIAAGVIRAIDPAGTASVTAAELDGPTGEIIDLDGHLVLPALVEPHAHLDKAFLAERIPNPTGDLIGAIHALDAARDTITVADTIERAERAVRLLVANGTTLIRTHADVTSGNGLASVEALHEVRRRTATLCDVQIVALVGSPVVGSPGDRHRALLREALQAGADLVGGCPHLEDDVDGATDTLLAIAAEFGRGVDLHTDETLVSTKLGLFDLARRVIESGFDQPVTASHCVSLGVQTEHDQARIAELVATAGISVIALPHTNLYLQGREHQMAMPRGLTAVRALRAAGVNVGAGADNLQDPFNPLGRGDPIETAGLMVLAGHLLADEALAAVTANSRRALCGRGAAVAVGEPADLVAIRASTIREAIAFAPAERVVLRGGTRVDIT